MSEGATTIAYADDLALIVTATSIKDLKEIAQDPLDAIAYWIGANKLSPAPEKTEAAVLITRR